MEGRQETLEQKSDEQQMLKKASMKKNLSVFNQLDQNGVSFIRNSSGILRDTSNDYNRATNSSRAREVNQPGRFR